MPSYAACRYVCIGLPLLGLPLRCPEPGLIRGDGHLWPDLGRGVTASGMPLRPGGTKASVVAATGVGSIDTPGIDGGNRAADRGTGSARGERLRGAWCPAPGSQTDLQLQCRDNGQRDGENPTQRHDQPRIHSYKVS